jgi:hypothetical protein
MSNAITTAKDGLYEARFSRLYGSAERRFSFGVLVPLLEASGPMRDLNV